MNENDISKIVFDCGLKVHKALGPGLLKIRPFRGKAERVAFDI
jgi:hypothetical protein